MFSAGRIERDPVSRDGNVAGPDGDYGVRMELSPRLIDVAVPSEPAGAVIVLHGGASRRESMMVSPTQLSVLRMIPIAKRIARAGRGRLAVSRLLNSRRGWTPTTHPSTTPAGRSTG